MAAAQLGTLLSHIRKLADGQGARTGTDRQLLDNFSSRHDEAAIAALVARHGPMVLRVCRRVLHHEHDAEDAFQAAFLVLAQNAGSIRKPEALADWLHGVAYRTAMKAKRSAARRRNHEARLRERTPSTAAGPTWDDVQAVLDEEIQRLPTSFRSAFVLCVLEGKTVPAAAAELGCKEGTVSSRLTRARQRLRQQLDRRGIKLAALLAALCVAESVGKAVVPGVLAQTAVRFGLLVASGGTAAGLISPHVAALATGVTKAMFLQNVKTATLVLLTVGLFAAGAGVLARQALAAKEQPVGRQKPAPATAREDAKPHAAADKDVLTYGGRVLGPDGKPVAGATLYLSPAGGYLRQPSPSPEYGTTGSDGRFTFTVPKAEFGDQFTVVTATAANHGPGWVEVPRGRKRDDLTLRLVADDVPITGQVIDLEGKPVPGATLTVSQINAAPGEDLGPWLEAAKDKKAKSFEIDQQYVKRYTIALAPKVTTDADGRFRLTGIGRNRLVRAQLDGPTIASQQFCVLTRHGKALELTEFAGRPEYGDPGTVTIYYGADFRHAAAPTKPIVGVVRDTDTKKPLAGMTIQSYSVATGPGSSRIVDIVRTTTDAAGRYRLTGLPKGDGYKIVAIPGGDQPYVVTNKDVPASPGLDPVTVNVELKRGVWIEGKMTDKVTGKPLRGAAEYFSLYSNPNLQDYPGFEGTLLMDRPGGGTKEDGSYRVVGLPGPGLIGVYYQRDSTLRAPDRDDEFGTKESSLRTSPYHISFTSNFNALARIDPAKGVDSVKRDVTLDPGWTLTGTLLGPDGKPLTGVRSFGLTGHEWDGEAMKTTEFTGWFNPRQPRDIFFQHREKGLIGVARPPKENGGSVTLRMGAGAAVAGRLVDADGKPRAGVELEVSFRAKGWRYWLDYPPDHIRTDREGRFRLEALLTDHEFRLSDGKDVLPFGGTLRAGQTKDLGDVRLKPAKE